MNYTTIEEAVAQIQSGESIFIHSATMTPQPLIDELVNQSSRLRDIEVVAIITNGKASYTMKKYAESFYHNSLFVGGNVRKGIKDGLGSYTPVFLSDINLLFERNIVPIDNVFIQVSPPDKHGYCSLGVSVDVSLAAIHSSKRIIAIVNPNVPRTHGDGIIHENDIDFAVAKEEDLFALDMPTPTAIEEAIGQNVASLIEDGSTLQMGIGAIPNVVLKNLNNHKRLGIHTEMFSDGILPLVESGVITGEEKKIKKGKIVTCFAMGTQKLFDFVDDNPLVHFKEASYTNNTAIIRQNPKVIAINSAIEVDLTGQVCADTIGSYQYSGVGGQMDFMRGSFLSEGGKPILAISSRTNKGKAKLVPQLTVGAGVTTTRAHVHYIVTEYGIANLFGKTLRDRAKSLINIAHPDDREMLTQQTFELLNIKV